MKKPKKNKATEADSKNKSNVSRELMLEVARVLDNAPSWVIFAHSKLDGDAVGSASALFEAGLARGKRVRWIGADPAPANFFFLPHVDKYAIQKKYKFNSKNKLYIFLDSANEDRGVEGLKEKSPEAVVLNIDHHEDNTGFGTLNCVCGGASSTSEVLWRIMTEVNWPITPVIAECLYTGVAADTGWFSFGNTTSSTHLMAADLLDKGIDPARIDSCVRHNRSLESVRLWGLALMRVFRWGEESQFAMTWLARRDFAITNTIGSDTAMLVNQMLMIRGVRFAALLVEDDNSGQIKINFRSKEGTVPAAFAARALGGGGHLKAAGANIGLRLTQAIQIVQETVDKVYAEWILAGR